MKTRIKKAIDADDIDFLKSNHEHEDIQFALYYACKKGKYSIAKFLIEEKHADPHLIVNFECLDDGPVFKFACESGNLELVKYLFETHHIDIQAKGTHPGTQDTAIMRAARGGHLFVVNYLLNQGASPHAALDDSPLTKAIFSGNANVVELLLSKGAKPAKLDLHFALEEGYLEIVRILIIYGANIHAYHFKHFTILAAESGNVELLKYLQVVHGLDILSTNGEDARYLNKKGQAAYKLLSAAAKSGSVAMMRYLIEECKLDITKYVEHEKTKELAYEWLPLSHTIIGNAIESKSIELISYLFEDLKLQPKKEILLKLKNKIWHYNIRMKAYFELFFISSAEDKKILLTLKSNGIKALSLEQLFYLIDSKLMENTHYEISDEIDKRNPTIYELSSISSSNLRAAILFFYANYRFKDDFNILRELIEDDLDVNLKNRHGESLLEHAFWSGSYNNIVEYLVNKGARVEESFLRKLNVKISQHLTILIATGHIESHSKIDLSERKLSKDSIIGISKSLMSRFSATHLFINFSGNKLSGKKMTPITDAISSGKTKKSLTLDMSRCHLEDDELEALALSLTFTPPQDLHLILNANNFEILGIKSLVDALLARQNKTRIRIDLCANNLSLACAGIIADSLSKLDRDNLILDLTSNFVGYEEQAREILMDQINNKSVIFSSFQHKAENEMSIPAALFCPISNNLMSEPVICLLDGFTYEATTIKDWLTVYRSSPINDRKIDKDQNVDMLLIKNRNLLDAIHAYQKIQSSKPSTNPGFFQPNDSENILSKFEDAIICPISFQRYKTPVLCVLDGRTYEKESIEKWLTSKRSSPINRVIMNPQSKVEDVLIENKNIKILVDSLEIANKEQKEVKKLQPSF